MSRRQMRGSKLARMIADKHDQAMVGECPQQRPVSDMTIQMPERSQQPFREAPYIGRRHSESDSAPVEHSELRSKRSLELADSEMVHSNLERCLHPVGRQSPKRFARTAAQQIPGSLPKAKPSQHTKSEITARVNQGSELIPHGVRGRLRSSVHRSRRLLHQSGRRSDPGLRWVVQTRRRRVIEPRAPFRRTHQSLEP